jgi:two-component system response regulator RpaA
MTTRRPPVILIVEDEPDVARLLAYRLRRRNFEAVTAADGQAGLNRALELKPDLIVLDLMLPKFHGLEVCRMLKASPITRDVPVLILTAVAGTADKVRGFACGADDYLTKPFAMAELLARVDTLLWRHERIAAPSATPRSP